MKRKRAKVGMSVAVTTSAGRKIVIARTASCGVGLHAVKKALSELYCRILKRLEREWKN